MKQKKYRLLMMAVICTLGISGIHFGGVKESMAKNSPVQTEQENIQTAAKENTSKEKIYAVGSVSKVYVTTAVMQLSEEGKVNLDEKVSTDMDSIIEVITLVRNLRNTENIANSIKLNISVYDKSENSRLVNAFNANINYLYKFTNAEEFKVSKEKDFGSNGRVFAIGDGELFVSLENAIDYDKELSRLNTELAKVEAGVKRGEAMFNNPSFMAKAPQFKIDTERKILDDYLSRKATILKRINELNELKNK